MEQELILSEETQTQVVEHNFERILNPEGALAIAHTLKGYADKQGLVTKIQGKAYAQVEAWQYAGSLIGLFPMVTEVVDLSTEKEFRWRATVEILNNDGQVKARGTAICSNKESKRRNSDEYAICSMAQTRATGKAFRLLIGWMFKLAKIEATPAEEMEQTDPNIKKVEPSSASLKKEYKEFVLEAVKCCVNASDVKELGVLAATFLKDDPDAKVIDAFRAQYKALSNVGNNE